MTNIEKYTQAFVDAFSITAELRTRLGWIRPHPHTQSHSGDPLSASVVVLWTLTPWRDPPPWTDYVSMVMS